MGKTQVLNNKSQININKQSTNKKYDLEERTFQFAKNVAIFCKTLPKTISNREYSEQVVAAPASVGANYIEANESLSKKDFVFRIKISRKESRESAFFLRLIKETDSENIVMRQQF